MDFGMPVLMEHRTFLEDARLCKELGFQFVELNMNFPWYGLEACKREYKEWKAIAAELGIYMTIHMEENLDLCESNPLVCEAYLQTLLETVEVSSLLEVPVLNLHFPKGIHVTLPEEVIYIYEKDLNVCKQRLQVAMHACEARMEGRKQKILFENLDVFEDFQIQLLEELIEYPFVGLTWDIGHSYTHQDIDESFLRKHLDKIAHYHIHDATKDKPHLPLGKGDSNVMEKLLLAEQKHARCVIEVKEKNALKESAQWLKAQGLF